MPKPRQFSFRQRAGRLDWRQISSVEVEDIILNLKVDELQKLLDTVTFSEIDLVEVKTSKIDDVTKLLQLMQLIIEYLLHHQENQFSVVHNQNKRIHHLTSKTEAYQRKLEAMKEDVRTYQRQLHILRKSLQAGGGGINTELLFRLVQQPPKITHPADLNPMSLAANSSQKDSYPSTEIVKVLLEHEHDARVTMHSMLEDQRRTFERELQSLSDALKQMQQQDFQQRQLQLQAMNQQAPPQDSLNPTTLTLLLENMKAQMENTARQLADSMKENLRSTPSTNHTEKTGSTGGSVSDILRSAAMETYASELKEREGLIAEREEALRRRERALDEAATRRRQSSLAMAESKDLKRDMALRLLFSSVAGINRRRMLRRFRHWLSIMFEARNQDLVDEHARLLLFANEKKSVQESSLQQTLNEEKQKTVVLNARLNAVTRDYEALQEASKLWEMKAEQADRTEALWQDKHKQEREKAVIAQAKYSSLMQRVETETEELRAKLLEAEDIIAQQANELQKATVNAHLGRSSGGYGTSSSLRFSRSSGEFGRSSLKPKQDTSVMTSFDFGTLNRSVQMQEEQHRTEEVQNTKNKVPATDLASLFGDLPVGGSLSEDIMLRNAQARILARNDRETLQQMAMATLAQDFLTKLKV